jgi:hypothetical protein
MIDAVVIFASYTLSVLQIFQKRMDGSQDFNQSYATYEEGFGSASGEYWLGKYYVCVRVFVLACVRVYVHECLHASVRACVCMFVLSGDLAT